MNVRRLLAAVGVAAAAVGLVMALRPGLAENVGADRAFLLFVGLLAAVQAGLDVQARRRTRTEQADFGSPEAARPPEPVGADLDRALSAAANRASRHSRERRNHVRERVERIAVRVLVRRHGCGEAEAEAMLAEGTWTDDPHAAAFFGAVEDDPSLRTRLWRLFRDDDDPFRLNAERAIDELARLDEP